MSGVIERVVENWLTSSNERSYQIPFCQLLESEGETVVYISPHGPFEQGKDVITVDPHGKTRAYQMKSGDFGLAEWRKFKGEITDLVELPVNNPAIPNHRQHQPFLVINGEFADPAIRAIESANQAWRRRRYPILKTISKGQLLKRFLSVHGSYLPQELPDFNLFLELVLGNGKGPLDKEKLSKLLEDVSRVDDTDLPSNLELKRACASLVLLSSYVLQSAQTVANHWAVFEGWTVVASCILAVISKKEIVSKKEIAEEYWLQSFGLCELAAVEALSALCSECEQRRGNLVEGELFTDGHFYHARLTLLVGLLSALALFRRLKGRRDESQTKELDFIHAFINTWQGKMKIWGESAIPYFLTCALELEASNNQIVSENLVLRALGTVVTANSQGPPAMGLPSPYYSAEDSLRLIYGLEEGEARESFLGSAYTALPMIDFLVRRLRRQSLRSIWYPITALHLKTFYPTEAWEWFKWQTKNGTLRSRFVSRPQSWAELMSEVEKVDVDVLPPALRRKPSFAILYVLVYPHRLTREVVKLIEETLRNTALLPSEDMSPRTRS